MLQMMQKNLKELAIKVFLNEVHKQKDAFLLNWFNCANWCFCFPFTVAEAKDPMADK